MWKACALLLLAAAAHGEQAFLQADDNPMQKVPVVGNQFKVNPVSTSMQCVISLTIQYMLVYTALALARTAAKSMGVDYGKTPILGILNTAVLTVNFAPMLAILFLACRMRVTWLTQGKGNPPVYVKTGDIKDDVQPFQNSIIAGLFTALKFLIMLGLYAGALIV